VLNQLVGPDEARFWKAYRENYITDEDINSSGRPALILFASVQLSPVRAEARIQGSKVWAMTFGSGRRMVQA